MEENMRRPVGNKKKLRKGRVAFTIFVLLFAITLVYSVVQYMSGMKMAKEDRPELEQFTPDTINNEYENYLLLGIDARGEEKSRTDTMMLVSVNKKTNNIKLVSFMRDIYADIPGYQSYKLNTAYYLGGVQLLKETLNNMFDVQIHHYALIDFKNFEQLVDILAPNGVEIDVEKDMSENIDVELKKGVHRLNGQELLGYARFRHDEEGDFGRVARQQKVIEALKMEVLSVRNVKNLPKLAGATQGYIATDVSNLDQIKMVLKVATSGMNVEKMTIPADGTYGYANYSHAGSVLQIDINQNKELLHEFLKK